MANAPEENSLKVRKKIGDVVYQATGVQFANAKTLHDPRRQRRRHVIAFDPATPEQQQQRLNMRLTVSLWKLLLPEEKEFYHREYVGKHYYDRYGEKHFYKSGFNYFVSLELRKLSGRA